MITNAAAADASTWALDAKGDAVETSPQKNDADQFDARSVSPNSAVVRRAIGARREEELDRMDPVGPISGFMLKWIGLNTTRRISNLCKTIGFGAFLKPVRVYPTMPANTPLQFEGKSTTVAKLAASLNPKLFTINDERTQKPSLKPTETRFEMLPSKRDANHYSLLYYVKAPDEDMPIPILGRLYDYVRPILWGSKADWEAVQIDINKQTGKPEGMVYESCNYTDKPGSYFARSSADLHLRCEVKKTGEGTWEHTLIQKNGSQVVSEISDPFSEGRPHVAYVSWNGGFDLTSKLKTLGYGSGEKMLEPLEDPAFSELDLDTFQDQGFDLRAGWLKDRKSVALPITMTQEA